MAVSGLQIKIPSLFNDILSMNQHQGQIKEAEVVEQTKKTRKNKASVPTLGNRSTRRAKRKDSSDQCALPQIIPRNQFPEIVLKQSFESQTTRLILQVPLSNFVGDQFEQIETTRVENMPLQLRLARQADNIILSLQLPPDLPSDQTHDFAITLHGKYSWLSGTSIINKPIKSVRKTVTRDLWDEASRLKLGSPIHSDLFVVLTLRGQEQLCLDYQGLVNQGNTCYMNSYLQMLFHLPQFRRLIFAADARESDKFPATLQMLFYKMLVEERAVSPEDLIRSFGWTKKDAQVQQDVQEFSCLFFDILERKVMVPRSPGPGSFTSVPELFCGELTHYIQCCQVEPKTLNASTTSTFPWPPPFETHSTITSASRSQTRTTSTAQTSTACSRRAKDYEFQGFPLYSCSNSNDFNSNQKILDECKYPEQMDFGQWTDDPMTSAPYQLYAVLVHQGSYASSGHYYVLIKVQNEWIKFNDERVERATKERALQYNYGGQSTTIQYDAKQMKVNLRSLQLKATAYMLVYVNKELYPILLEDIEPDYPQWLIEQTKNRQEMQQEKKIRKQSICDLPIMRWNKQFQCQEAAILGLIPKDINAPQERIQSIPKSQKVEDWLQELGSDSEDKFVYIFWTVQERQILINADSKGTLSVKQLFNEVQQPMIIFAPISVTKQEYLVIIKLYNQHNQVELTYYGLNSIRKEAQISQLHKLLASLFPQQPFNNYYLQDKKNGLVCIMSSSDDLLPSSSPSRNQLLIVVVEQLTEKEESKAIQLYKSQMERMLITFKHQHDKQFPCWERELNKYITVSQIRQIIFQEILHQSSEYQSARNIVVKYKSKKNSKILTESSDDDILKDIVKNDKTLHFSFSNLNINERLTQKQLIYFYRMPSRKLSQPQKTIVDKSQQNTLLQLISQSPAVKANLPQQQNMSYRMYLLAKDRSYINDIVDQKGYIQGKGQLLATLQRQKNTALVIQQYKQEQKETQLITVLIHHVTKTGERIGNPIWEQVPPSMLLSSLKDKILDLLIDEQVQFQGRVIQVSTNPIKIRVLAYVKQWGKAQELPDLAQFEEQNPVPNETVQSKYGKPRYLRVGIVHNYISKSVQALKLNVE